jgi:hypothetical protein
MNAGRHLNKRRPSDTTTERCGYKLHRIKIISRTALGLVWFYEGLVPKILFLRTDEIFLVRTSHLAWRTPELTLLILALRKYLLAFG